MLLLFLFFAPYLVWAGSYPLLISGNSALVTIVNNDDNDVTSLNLVTTVTEQQAQVSVYCLSDLHE